MNSCGFCPPNIAGQSFPKSVVHAISVGMGAFFVCVPSFHPIHTRVRNALQTTPAAMLRRGDLKLLAGKKGEHNPRNGEKDAAEIKKEDEREEQEKSVSFQKFGYLVARL